MTTAISGIALSYTSCGCPGTIRKYALVVSGSVCPRNAWTSRISSSPGLVDGNELPEEARVSEPEFFASAENADQKCESEHMCEAFFYSGSKHLFAGDNQVAIDLFKKCIATGRKDSCEYDSALAELKLSTDPGIEPHIMKEAGEWHWP